MAKKPKSPPSSAPHEEVEPAVASDAGRREALIRANVLKALGRPAKLFRVAVMPLWDNNYRVNVVTGEEFSSCQIPNSYFVRVDDDGTILGSTPDIKKQY